MNIQNQIALPDAATIGTLPYRDAIDRVATLRALVMRLALGVSQMSCDRSDSQMEKLRETLQAQVKTLHHTLAVLRGQAEFSTLPDTLSLWLAGIAATQEAHLQVIARMAAMTDRLSESALTEDGAPSETLDAYVAFGQGEFFEAVSALTEEFWARIEDGRATQLDQAMQSAARLGEGLTRLERIGKYVRSMSINASVEASRAGEAGKGLAIIAQEFKVLAEEVQQLTLSAREDIESIEAS
ncbi:methyl-accepting chemotaxis protein [uncultured Roseobacter sp.]|uniref:methyl-accepting chemotaxis protein n=1 Tax=uncultured Roseobacter sp. TaxID=114847 RepID=UPI002623432B|nr:methyl-accepting chemotaxis protein [uncultured Roseobacter sp.]